VVAVVIFPDNIFKYASSVCRHFPDLCPAQDAPSPVGTGRYDQIMEEMLENLKNPFDSVAVAELARDLGGSAGPVVIDVRPASQFADLHIPASINLPQAELSSRKTELPPDRDTPIVMVCGIGKFSKPTTLFLKSLGYRNVRSLKGGINEWVRKQLPTEPARAAVKA
jgi:rhodanese-related sulfurtransferase